MNDETISPLRGVASVASSCLAPLRGSQNMRGGQRAVNHHATCPQAGPGASQHRVVKWG